MAVTLSYPTLTTSPASKSEVEANFNVLAQKFGQIVNADIADGAGISVDKLSGQYEYMTIPFILSAGSASNDVLVPFYNDNKGDWTVVGAQWVTDDTGTPTGVISIKWGILDGTATDSITNNWTNVTTICTMSLAGANVSGQGVASSVTSFSFGAAGVYRSLRCHVSTTDANATATIWVSLLLKRKITT